MKRMSQIAKELRDHGRKFSQTTFQEDLATFKPVFAEGKVIFYEDSVTDVLMSKYKVRPPAIQDIPVIEVQEPQYDRLIRVESMLRAICNDLNIAVH